MNNAELRAASALAQLPNLMQEQTKVLRDIAAALAYLAFVQHCENRGLTAEVSMFPIVDAILTKAKEAANVR